VIKSKLIKIKHVSKYFSESEINIKVDDEFIGQFEYWPIVGRKFVFFRFGDEFHDYYGPIITTEVLEIIDDRTFKTKNSIYLIITERDENIEKILQ
jgi:hypothetical protein